MSPWKKIGRRRQPIYLKHEKDLNQFCGPICRPSPLNAASGGGR